jgi:hypothetical protein
MKEWTNEINDGDDKKMELLLHDEDWNLQTPILHKNNLKYTNHKKGHTMVTSDYFWWDFKH